MKSILRVVSIGLVVVTASGAEERATPTAELDAIKAELKPLRERAYVEADVIAARKALDDAYRAYWDAVRSAMVRLDPEKKSRIDREIALRKSLNAVRGEAPSRPTPKTDSKNSAE